MVTEKSADTHSLRKVQKSRPMCKGRHGGERKEAKAMVTGGLENQRITQKSHRTRDPEIRKKVVEKVETATPPRTMNSG